MRTSYKQIIHLALHVGMRYNLPIQTQLCHTYSENKGGQASPQTRTVPDALCVKTTPQSDAN